VGRPIHIPLTGVLLAIFLNSTAASSAAAWRPKLAAIGPTAANALALIKTLASFV
jgi:hypothetical protein